MLFVAYVKKKNEWDECEKSILETAFPGGFEFLAHNMIPQHHPSFKNCSDMPEYMSSLNEKMTFSDVSIYVWW
jgi:hypothetical protein